MRKSLLGRKIYMPDLREKVKEIISDIDEEINRLMNLPVEEFTDVIEMRVVTLNEVKGSLENRLEEVI